MIDINLFSEIGNISSFTFQPVTINGSQVNGVICMVFIQSYIKSYNKRHLNTCIYLTMKIKG